MKEVWEGGAQPIEDVIKPGAFFTWVNQPINKVEGTITDKIREFAYG